MEICIIGVSHQTTPVEVRERLSFSGQKLQEALLAIRSLPNVKECLIISTCNRTEIIAVIKEADTAIDEITAFTLKFHNIDKKELPQGFYVYRGVEAVKHIFRVASSLDSLVVGEPQILGQVKEAFQHAQDKGTIGPLLNNLITMTIRVAKKVRTDTGIAKNAVSISFAAVELAKKIFGEISDKIILLIGAGEMSELAARHLINNGVKRIIVANRTWQRAKELSNAFAGEAVQFDMIQTILYQADIIITSTGAPHFILKKEHISKAMRRRKQRPIFIIDIAVPRDVDPKVNKYDNVYLYDIDDLQIVVDANLKERQKEARKAAELINHEVNRFLKNCALTKVEPTIAQLSSFMEKIRKQEIERALSHLPPLENGQRKVLEAMSCAIIKKILYHPISKLKEADDPEDLESLIRATEKLFNLKNNF